MTDPLRSGPAPAIVGVTPAGEAILLEFAASDADVLFLTSDCKECRQCWARAREGDVIVTPDPSTDSRKSVAKLAPAGVTVVMSSRGWHSYGVAKAPWVVGIRSGDVTSSRPAV